jgi:hypothetical protein
MPAVGERPLSVSTREIGDTRLRRALRPLIRPAVARVERWRTRKMSVRQRWDRALPGEVRWARRVLTDPAAKARWVALQPTYEWSAALPPAYARAADRLPRGLVRAVDVGAGPATAMPRSHPGRTFEITAVDPLADEYNALLDEIGIDVPVRSRAGTGERLLDVVDAGSFDLAHARNSIDHAYDPALAIRNMVLAVKPRTGLVVLRHERNEAVNESYRRLHQWNLDAADGDLILWRPGVRRNLTQELSELVEGDVSVDGRWIIWVGRRR